MASLHLVSQRPALSALNTVSIEQKCHPPLYKDISVPNMSRYNCARFFQVCAEFVFSVYLEYECIWNINTKSLILDAKNTNINSFVKYFSAFQHTFLFEPFMIITKKCNQWERITVASAIITTTILVGFKSTYCLTFGSRRCRSSGTIKLSNVSHETVRWVSRSNQ